MERVKAFSLNSLLALLVILSIGLSIQVWFPADQIGVLGAREPHIQVPPPAREGKMPDMYRPERIYVEREEDQVALLQSGTASYGRVLRATQAILNGSRVFAAPIEVSQLDREETKGITLIFPVALTLAEWADRWHWSAPALQYASVKIDRVLFLLDEIPAIYLYGPSGQIYRLGPLANSEQNVLYGLIAALEGDLFTRYRPLQTEGLSPRILPNLLVPEVSEVPIAIAVVRKPEPKWEEIRYFPDLSVVRQIDEKDANSFTDGQRLLRLITNGILEYRTANVQGTAPQLSRAEGVAQDWIDARGGWPQDLVLGSFLQEPGKTSLIFELRTQGPYPVESSGGALIVQVAADREVSADRIVSLRRFPAVSPIFEESTTPVIAPETAVQMAAKSYSRLFLFEPLREVHLAYLVEPGTLDGEPAWRIEPAWVLQVGEDRLYIPASAADDQQFHLIDLR